MVDTYIAEVYGIAFRVTSTSTCIFQRYSSKCHKNVIMPNVHNADIVWFPLPFFFILHSLTNCNCNSNNIVYIVEQRKREDERVSEMYWRPWTTVCARWNIICAVWKLFQSKNKMLHTHTWCVVFVHSIFMPYAYAREQCTTTTTTKTSRKKVWT